MTEPQVQESGSTHWARYWRIVPKRSASDQFARKFGSREAAEEMLAIMQKRHTYKVAAYDRNGKRLP